MCIETKSKNGKRLMRRVRVVNKAEHLQPYMKRVCEVLGCCSELVSATRYPLGYCSTTCCLKGQYTSSYACSRRSDSGKVRRIGQWRGEQRAKKKKKRGKNERTVPSLPVFSLAFPSSRPSPLSECLGQTTSSLALFLVASQTLVVFITHPFRTSPKNVCAERCIPSWPPLFIA